MITLTFAKSKETKNCLQYAEETTADRPTVGTIYLLKSAAAQLGNPEKIKVSIDKA